MSAGVTGSYTPDWRSSPARINEGVRNGTLSETEAKQAVQDELKALSKEVHSERTDTLASASIDRGVADGTQLDAAVKSGKVTPEQAASFKSQLETLAKEGTSAAGAQPLVSQP